jgi:hypothetical protein
MYALAAGAAGVSAMASVPPSHAEIVYTPTHQVTAPQQVLSIDLNHDGIKDFRIVTSYAEGSGFFTVGLNAYQYYAGRGNRIVGQAYYPAALRAGQAIGPKRHFSYNAHRMAREGFTPSLQSRFWGPWANSGKGVKNRYLGLKFIIKGKVHYGWARMTVTVGKHPVLGDVQGTLTGYAYETIPRKPIIAGQTKGSDVITVQPTSLGRLALGRK